MRFLETYDNKLTVCLKKNKQLVLYNICDLKLIMNLENIDFTKYLACPDCKSVAFYCPKHKLEVENFLSGSKN